MTIFRKELRQGRYSLLGWSVLLTFMLSVCIVIYPQMKEQMAEISDSFSQMGQFSQAFGMDQLNMGKFQDYFSMEFSNVMGLLGSMFAALLGIRALAAEEGEHTSEFLLTHPVTRPQVVGEKLLALAVQVIALNLLAGLCSLGLIGLIGEEVEEDKLLLLFFGNCMMHLELSCMGFGLSAFLSRSNFILGISIGAGAYFLNLISDLMEELQFLKYLTPMGYSGGAYILTEGTLPWKYFASGMVLLILSCGAAFLKYSKKDMA